MIVATIMDTFAKNVKVLENTAKNVLKSAKIKYRLIHFLFKLFFFGYQLLRKNHLMTKNKINRKLKLELEF